MPSVGVQRVQGCRGNRDADSEVEQRGAESAEVRVAEGYRA